jgi:ribonuclease BN (tRNA processing enzyme)
LPVIRTEGFVSEKAPHANASPVGQRREEKQMYNFCGSPVGGSFRMSDARKGQALAVILLFGFAWRSASFAQSAPATNTQVVMLGTGTPLPDPDRSGPSTAIVVNDTAYIVDAGTGVVRRAVAAHDKGVKALEPTNLRIAFLTHLHADHTLGLPDLILTPWIMGRKEPLDLYGPAGTREMVAHILQAYDADIKTRTEGLEHSNRTGYKVNVHEITPGVVYKDASVTVKAFNAYHGSPQNTFGYRFETPGRVIVISGDATPKSDVLLNCNGCDVLIHEVYTQASFDKVSPEWKQYREAFHTSTRQLAEIANKTKPDLLILYHRANPGCDQARTQDCRDAGSEEQMLKEIREHYKGKVTAGHDLDVY